MGLDIICFRDVKFVSKESEKDDEEAHNHDDLIHIFKTRGCVDRTDGLFGFYQGESGHSFRAGGYGGYNHWRNTLAQCMLSKTAQEVWAIENLKGPFVELINFSDCEGFIGPKTSAKLAADFATHDEKAQTYAEETSDKSFYQKYQEWRKAFETVADNGVVRFC